MVGEVAAADKLSRPSAIGDFVIRHWRSSAPASRDPTLRGLRPATRPAPLDLISTSHNGGSDYERRHRAAEVPGYTSLRDLIDSPPPNRSALSPGAGPGWEIRIRNRLVKQAAYAYLQPTPSASEFHNRRRPCRSLRRFLRVLTCGLAVEPLDACVEFLRRLFSRPRR